MLKACFFLSFLILLISGIVCALWNLNIHIKRLSKAQLLNPVNVFSVFVFIAFLVLFIPNAYAERGENIVLTLLSAFFDTMDGLSFGNRLENMIERFFSGLPGVPEGYVFYACIVSFMVPVLAMRAVFYVFRDWFTQASFSLNRRKVFHIFSELNDRSLTLAKDIMKEDKKARVVFAQTSKKSTDNIYIEQARKINALLTDKTLNGFKTESGLSDKKLYLYFIGDNKKENIKLALDKFESIRKASKETVVFVFSDDPTAECVVDLANSTNSNPKIRLELFNEAQRTAYNIVYEHPFYDVKSDDGSINIMILGAGHIGVELAKAVTWCSQMINRKVYIRVYDKEKMNEKLGFPFNGLSEKLKKIGTTVNLEFYNCDIFSDKFDSLRFERADYITIDIGNDTANMAAALMIREIYARQNNGAGYFPSDRPSPEIIAVIENSETRKIMESLGDSSIIPYGTLSDIFSLNNIINWKIDKAGEFLHACYYSFNRIKSSPAEAADGIRLMEQGIKDYAVQSEINKRSSRSSAIHSKYKLFDMDVAAFDELTQAELESMIRCEHNRWNVFQTLDGWAPWEKSGLIKGRHKDKKAKLHAYLADFDELKAIAGQIYGKSENPIEYDRIMVMSSALALEYAESGRLCKEKTEQLIKSFKEQIRSDENEKVLS